MTPASPFLEGTFEQIYWDATAISLLRECEQKYKYNIIDGLRAKNKSVHLIFGSLYTKALERHAILLTHRVSYDDAIAEVVLLALRETVGWEFENSVKNRFTLVRTIIFYLEEYRNDKAETVILADGTPAVELPFILKLSETIMLTGRLDRVVRLNGEIFIMDHKTTGTTPGDYYFAQYTPNPQVSLYSIAGRIIFKSPIAGVIICVAHIGVGFSRFARATIYRTPAQNEEWLSEVSDTLVNAHAAAAKGRWTKNDTACHKFAGCEFRPICSRDPSVRQIFIDSDYEKGRAWNSLTTSENNL